MNDLSFEVFLAWKLGAIAIVMIEVAGTANQIAAGKNLFFATVFIARY